MHLEESLDDCQIKSRINEDSPDIRFKHIGESLLSGVVSPAYNQFPEKRYDTFGESGAESQ
jgi:hypothetical protein